ncbi:MAG: Eco57I restriction-modification methylase domain-containing protein [Candidatus Cloacimonadales bacterium]|nr:Eco57I restriction-modification methylase domain-containing protein [Candidatus Cloacimonadales bacterium]
MTLDWTLNPAETKKKIIENSIYGVGIDSGAIDIARLRFWLSLIVDAEVPEPLPNLDYKIMQGNSLLESFEGIDLSNVMSDNIIVKTEIDNAQDVFDFADENPQQQMVFSDDRKQKVQDLKHDYFAESDLETKKDIHKQIDEIVLEHIGGCLEIHKDNLQLNISILSKELKGRVAGKDKATKNHVWNVTKKGKQLKQWELELSEVDNKFTKLEELQYSTDRPFFLWHLYFSEVFENTPSPINRSHPSKRGEFNGGFDIVIGNPPYVSALTMKRDNPIKAYIKEEFPQVSGSYDLYTLFILKGEKLASLHGVYTWIIPNKFLISDYSKETMEFLIKNGLSFSIDVSSFQVFGTTGVYPVIIFGNKAIYKQNFKTFLLMKFNDLNMGNFLEHKKINRFKTFKDYGFIIQSGTTGMCQASLDTFVV